ncbi:MAG: helix-turn-helix transcriptional regulator [Bacteroidia bacterium]|nr:helix-turn-helix transcriptional regulator [Bacteroidia bacterium]
MIGWGNYENTIGLVLAFTAPVAMELGIHFNRPYIDLEKEDINLYKGIYENLIREFSKSDAKSEAIIHSGIGYLYALFGRFENVPDVNDKVITALRNIVCRDFSAVITTRQLAGLLKLSHKGLNERCVQKIGRSVKQFVLELRMTEAKRLLAFSPLTNSEIAYASGFDDPSYFARIFRKKVGYSPTIFRKKYRKEA